MKISAFVAVNENTDLAVSDNDRLLLITKAGNQQTITTIGFMSEYTFNGMQMALDRLRPFIIPNLPSKSAILQQVADEKGHSVIDIPLNKET